MKLLKSKSKIKKNGFSRRNKYIRKTAVYGGGRRSKVKAGGGEWWFRMDVAVLFRYGPTRNYSFTLNQTFFLSFSHTSRALHFNTYYSFPSFPFLLLFSLPSFYFPNSFLLSISLSFYFFTTNFMLINLKPSPKRDEFLYIWQEYWSANLDPSKTQHSLGMQGCWIDRSTDLLPKKIHMQFCPM